MTEVDVLKKAEDFITELYRRSVPDTYCYHSIHHTNDVVKTCQEIGEAEGLKHDELEVLLLAAWFHDSGYSKQYEHNELAGAIIAEEFLQKIGYPKEKAQTVKKLILATDLSIIPSNKLQNIIRDADLNHVGRADFFERNELLRKEWHNVYNKSYSDSDWEGITLSFLQLHNFHTEYAINNLQPTKEAHLAKLLNQKKD